jgi:2-polyprenyl-3-methyl-5-hydroxy-6-metoxy-1,4-benzoquinol methylase
MMVAEQIVSGYAPFEALADLIGTRLAAEIGREGRVLDVSCGTGILARRLAAHGLGVTGIDPVASLATLARRRTPAAMTARLSFDAADIAREPIAGALFDALVSMHTLGWHPDRRAFLAGCRASLRPGAPAIFVAATRPPAVVPTMRRLAARDGFSAALRALRWLVPTALFERVRNTALYYPSERELVATLEAAGFDVRECVPTFVADLSLLVWARRRRSDSIHGREERL